ncbi:MAG: archease [Actinomycetota bacterium]
MTHGHRPIEHTADCGIEAWASDLPGLFEECAAGMFQLMFSAAPAVASIAVSATGSTYEEVLVGWLSELLYVAETRGLALSAFIVDRASAESVEGWVGGVPPTAARTRGTPIKAVTHHGLKVRHDGVWRAQVIFDA